MARRKGLQELFKRYRRPGDLVFAWIFLLFALFLLSQLGTQAPWKPGGKTFSQPAFWPSVALWSMAGFALLHLVSSALSPRLAGRWREVGHWVRSLEYVGWFLAYVFVVPRLGYLPTTVLFALLLGLRAGYRSGRSFAALAAMAVAIVVIFKSLLQVRIPGGAIYEMLPPGLRSTMLTYF